jgi:outer membrane autotransporter protein
MKCSALLSRTIAGLAASALLGCLGPFALPAGAATPTFDANCNSCHVTPAEGARINAAGAAAVVTAANTNHSMSLTAGQISLIPTIVAEFDTHFFGGTTRNEPIATVNYHSVNNSITMTTLVIDATPIPVITSTSVSGGGTTTPKGTATGTPNSLVLKYTHTANDCVQDQFLVVGTGDATTAPRTLKVSITHPASPTATGTTSSVAYSTGASATQALTVGGGPTASIVIDTQPAVGSVAPSGIGFTYTGSSTQYSPSVTFTWHALGPCGEVSSTVTQTVNVSLPPAPTTSNKSQTVQSNVTTNISLTANVTGIFTPPITISAQPVNGTAVVVNNTTVDYTPNTNFSGPDPFSYTATGPGGTSSPAGVVSITVTASPLVANKSVTTAFQTAIPIDLTSSITGAFTSVAVASPPSHGNAVVGPGSGVITYTPAAGYSGTDSFTYTATGAGGTSTPATVNITVNPPAPVAGPKSFTVPSGIASPLDVASAITGVSTSVAVATPPAHGSASPTGPTTFSYTPTTNYVGADSFTYTATGPGGASAPATITLTVTPPPPPGSTSTNITVPYNSTTAIPLYNQLSGVFSSVTIQANPAHGTLTLQGMVALYTPTTGYYGPDSFTFIGVGLGGSSPLATVNITVSPPGPPTVAARTLSVPFNTATPIDLAGAVTGVFTSITVSTQPQHGTVTVSGSVVTYKPANNYTGPDSFAFTATGPGGTSAPADVSITVNTAPPVAGAAAMNVNLDGTGTLDLAPFISGSGVSGVSIGTPPGHGTATVNGTKVTYAPNPGFFGKDTFTYLAYGNAGTSPPATVTITVVGRPNPTRDPAVPGLIGAQNSTAQRFGRAQISNVQSRLESLHSRAPSPENVAAAPPAPRAPEMPRAKGEEPIRVAGAGPATGLVDAVPPATTSALSSALANSIMSLAGSQSMNVAAATGANDPRFGGLEFWVAGTMRFGNIETGGPMRFTTDGVSAGVDKRISRNVSVGVGLGYARDKTDIGTDGSKTRTDGTSVAAYGSFAAAPNTYVDALLGFASLDMDTDRFVGMMGEFAKSSRKGDQWFGSLSLAYEYRQESMILSPYGRLDYASTRLKQATESGGGAGALTYFEQTVPMFQGVVGLRAESQHETRFGAVRPRARIEYSHEFEGDRNADVAYADLFGTRYTVTPTGTKRNAMLLGIGSDFLLGRGMKVSLDYQTRRASRDDVDQGIRLQFTQALDGKGGPWAQWFAPYSNPFHDPVRVDASYTYDDNVTRARDSRDVLADSIFSFGAAQSRIFPTSTNTRVVAAVFVNGDELRRYNKLARFSGGGQAEFQYRTSGEWDATTFGAQGRVSGDYYDSELRRGWRYSVSLTARQSLTDRIDAFAALMYNHRDAKNAVFDASDYGGKFNLDYSLGGPNGSLYLAGEYRKGDIVSSGRYSLMSLDTADVFTQDDAFGPGYFAYRFDARTWLGTFGYNRPLGPRDAIDFSYRRAESTPTKGASIPSSGPNKYIDNQYSIIYLMRF